MLVKSFFQISIGNTSTLHFDINKLIMKTQSTIYRLHIDFVRLIFVVFQIQPSLTPEIQAACAIL